MMFSSEIHVHANDRKKGMDQEEMLRAISDAAHAGFTEMGRVEVGFKGQVQSMKFRKPKPVRGWKADAQ